MPTILKLNTPRHIKKRRLDRIINAKSENEATKMGALDTIKDWFCSTKKINALKLLYNITHKNDNNTSVDAANSLVSFVKLRKISDLNHQQALEISMEQETYKCILNKGKDTITLFEYTPDRLELQLWENIQNRFEDSKKIEALSLLYKILHHNNDGSIDSAIEKFRDFISLHDITKPIDQHEYEIDPVYKSNPNERETSSFTLKIGDSELCTLRFGDFDKDLHSIQKQPINNSTQLFKNTSAKASISTINKKMQEIKKSNPDIILQREIFNDREKEIFQNSIGQNTDLYQMVKGYIQVTNFFSDLSVRMANDHFPGGFLAQAYIDILRKRESYLQKYEIKFA